MIPLLLTISFILHFISLLTILLLFRQLRFEQAGPEETTEEVYEVMELFLKEIREENEKLRKMFTKKKEFDLKSSPNEEIWTELTELDQKEKQPYLSTINQEYVNNHEQIKEQNDKSLDQPLSIVYKLYEEGISIEEIAKKLKRGKTEIALMIKLRHK